MYINVKKKKTLSIARYTLYGKVSQLLGNQRHDYRLLKSTRYSSKHREDSYNMKVLKSFVDELLEYLHMGTYEVNSALDSLIFWS